VSVIVTLTITCRDHAIAHKVMTDYFPSLDTLLEAPGIRGVSATYYTTTKQGEPDEHRPDAPDR
jgi:hypothetical protein